MIRHESLLCSNLPAALPAKQGSPEFLRKPSATGIHTKMDAVKFLPLLLAVTAAAAQDTETARTFEHFYNLDFDRALADFTTMASRRPQAARIHNHVAQTILFRQMLRAGALESEMVTGGNTFLRREKMNPTAEDERHFHQAIAESMRLSQQRLAGNPNDERGLYDLGVAHALRSNWNYLVRKSWMDSLRDATDGRKLHNKITQLNPANIDARMMQGMHDYIVGSLSWHWRMLGFLTGLRGDRLEGIKTLQLVAEKGDANRVDAAVILCVIYRRERRSAEAIPMLEKLIRDYPRNYIFRLEIAQMFSDFGKKEQALASLAEVERMKRAGAPGFDHLPIEKVYYFRGNIQFWYNDLDAAIINLERVTSQAGDLDLNTGVMAWLRLGQTYDLKGQRQKAKEAYRHAMEFAPGSAQANESRDYLREPYRRPKKS